MSNVRVSWEEYGITKKRYRELREVCQVDLVFPVVEDVVTRTNELIAPWLAKAVERNIPYEQLEYDRVLGRIPCGKSDFYGYRRRFFFLFNEELAQMKKRREVK